MKSNGNMVSRGGAALRADCQRYFSLPEGMKGALNNSPSNILYADRKLILRYMNPASVEALKTLQHLLPVKVEEMIGKPIDIFRENPEQQRRILADPGNLPHRENVKLGPETLGVLATAMYNSRGDYLGPMITWKLITRKLELEHQIEQNAAILSSSSERLTAISQQMAGNAEETALLRPKRFSASQRAGLEKRRRGGGQFPRKCEASIRESRARSASEAARIAKRAVDVAGATNHTIAKLR